MLIQREVYTRDQFLAVFGVDANAWTQRSFRGETAMAFGLARTTFTNEYGELDMFATMLTILIVLFARVDMGVAAREVRNHWRAWLDALAKVERLKRPAIYSEGACFVVASDLEKTRLEVEVGPCQNAMDDISKRCGPDMVPFPMPLDLVLRHLRKLAKKADVSLPKTLTPAAPGSDEYEKWIAGIENYRQVAATRRTSGKKAKASA